MHFSCRFNLFSKIMDRLRTFTNHKQLFVRPFVRVAVINCYGQAETVLTQIWIARRSTALK
mgnify:CR=1 FL=1